MRVPKLFGYLQKHVSQNWCKSPSVEKQKKHCLKCHHSVKMSYSETLKRLYICKTEAYVLDRLHSLITEKSNLLL